MQMMQEDEQRRQMMDLQGQNPWGMKNEVLILL